MKAKKSSELKGKNLIGIDETNNGSNDSPLVICGYLMMNYPGNHNGIGKYENKRSRAFNPKTPFEKVRPIAEYYLSRHRNYYYTTIKNDNLKYNLELRALFHASAFTSIILKFIQIEELPLEDTFAAVHYVGSKEFNERVLQDANKLLESMKIRIPIFASKKALGRYIPVKKAHWVGHYLAALKLRGNMKDWPHTDRLIGLDTSRTYLRYCKERHSREL